MPQTNRKDSAAQRAQDKESKRARGAMSCAECRRLKLKCDKTIPCSSCKRRGCAQICPNGSLITGQGTRFVLASTEKLHSKISQMSDRIRLLEDALAILQSSLTSEPHPLLSRELLNIKSSIELHSAGQGHQGRHDIGEEVEESQYIDAFGTLAIRDDGAATFYGRSAGSESLLLDEHTSPTLRKSPSQPSFGSRHQLSPPVSNVSNTFPLPPTEYVGVDMETLAESFLPPWSEAWRLCELYLEQAFWFFGAVTKRQLHEELLPFWYREAQPQDGRPERSTPTPTRNSPANSPSPGTSTNTDSLFGKGSAHDLALLFIIFCFGAITDVSLPPPPDNAEAEQYHRLSLAAMALEPVLERPPSVATVQALALMAIYHGLSSGENSIENTWALFGLATRLSQSIGLHRDCARWKLSPAEVQKRRSLFWELFITDGWQSLATGRLATFSIPFVDCELPYDPDEKIAEDGSIQHSFPAWKARFGYECVSAVVEGTLTSKAPRYSVILELDRKIRDMELPRYAQGETPKNAGLAETMSYFMPHNYRDLTLLYIHRCFFAHAISTNPNDPIKSQYAPSFLAGYRSACNLVNGLKEQFYLFPTQIARFWVLWTHAFSSAVMLSSVVTHSATCKVAPAALLELRMACDLFEKGAVYGGRARKFLPILQRLHKKAHEAYQNAQQLGASPRTDDIFTPTRGEAKQDELSIFSGKTYTVATKANLPASRGPRKSSVPSSSSSSSSGSPSQEAQSATIPSFAGVHPLLVDELHTLDGHLNDQIRKAYYNDNDVFAKTLMEQLQQQQQPQMFASQSYMPMAPSPPGQQLPTTRMTPTGQVGYQGVHGGMYTPSTMYERGSSSPSSASSPSTASSTGSTSMAHYRYQSGGYESTARLPSPQGSSCSSSSSSFQTYQNTPQDFHHPSYMNIHAHPQAQYYHPDHGAPPPQQQQQMGYRQWLESGGGHEQGYPGMSYARYHPQQQQQPQHGQGTSERGEDVGIQETWTSFMYQVGSPAAFMDD